MLHRLFITGIVFFWLLMTGALVQVWLDPASSEVLAVPVEHVVRQIFAHEQPSSLSILQGGQRIGTLTLRPRHFDAEGVCSVDFSGNVMIAFPFLPKQTFVWRGSARMSQSFTLRNLRLHIDAPGQKATTDLEIDPGQNRALCSVRQRDGEPVVTEIPLDPKGAGKALETLGVDPAVVEQIAVGAKGGSTPFGPLSVTARQSETEIEGERIQSYQVAARQNDSPLIEADISHLGQILGIKTIFGFTFAPEN